MNTERNPSTPVTFDVGGTLYKVSRSLLERYPDTMLARMVSKEWGSSGCETHFIDRNGTRFQYVLDFMREGSVILPAQGISKAMFFKDLDYYGFNNVQPENVSLDCAIGDSIKHLSSAEDEYKQRKRKLIAEVEVTKADFDTQKQALKEEFARKEKALKEEHEKKQKAMEMTHTSKQKGQSHCLACLEVAHFFFNRFRAGETLLLKLLKRGGEVKHPEFDCCRTTKTVKPNREKTLLELVGPPVLPIPHKSNVLDDFYNWAMSKGALALRNDPELKETLGKFGLEIDKCLFVQTKELPKGWKKIDDGNPHYVYNDGDGFRRYTGKRPENEEMELQIYACEKRV